MNILLRIRVAILRYWYLATIRGETRRQLDDLLRAKAQRQGPFTESFGSLFDAVFEKRKR